MEKVLCTQGMVILIYSLMDTRICCDVYQLHPLRLIGSLEVCRFISWDILTQCYWGNDDMSKASGEVLRREVEVYNVLMDHIVYKVVPWSSQSWNTMNMWDSWWSRLGEFQSFRNSWRGWWREWKCKILKIWWLSSCLIVDRAELVFSGSALNTTDVPL